MSLAPLFGAGTHWEGGRALSWCCTALQRRGPEGAAPASGISPHLRGGSGKEKAPPMDCACPSQGWHLVRSQSVGQSGLSLASSGLTSRWQAEIHGSVETIVQERS